MSSQRLEVNRATGWSVNPFTTMPRFRLEDPQGGALRLSACSSARTYPGSCAWICTLMNPLISPSLPHSLSPSLPLALSPSLPLSLSPSLPLSPAPPPAPWRYAALLPMRVMGDGNCLLHACSVAMWGVQVSPLYLSACLPRCLSLPLHLLRACSVAPVPCQATPLCHFGAHDGGGGVKCVRDPVQQALSCAGRVLCACCVGGSCAGQAAFNAASTQRSHV